MPVALKDNLCTRGAADDRRLADPRALTCRRTTPTVVERLEARRRGDRRQDELRRVRDGLLDRVLGVRPDAQSVGTDRTPGGSSGGSAAAVAARLVPLALGSDTGGSIRQPAALCGVVGLKPTYGRVSRYGLLAFASSLDQIGPITTTVADAAACLSVIAGHDPRDATSSHGAGRGLRRDADRRSCAACASASPAACSATASIRKCSPRCDRSLELAARAGAELVDVELPHSAHAIAVYYLVAMAEASSNLSRYDGVRYGYRASRRGDPRRALRSDPRRRLRRRGQAPHHPRHLRPELRLLRRVLPEGAAGPHAHPAGLRARLRARRRRRHADEPDGRVQARRPDRGPAPDVSVDVFTVGVNLAGLPGVSVPVRVDAERLPIGLQFIGRSMGEATILRVADAVERATPSARELPPDVRPG